MPRRGKASLKDLCNRFLDFIDKIIFDLKDYKIYG